MQNNTFLLRLCTFSMFAKNKTTTKRQKTSELNYNVLRWNKKAR